MNGLGPSTLLLKHFLNAHLLSSRLLLLGCLPTLLQGLLLRSHALAKLGTRLQVKLGWGCFLVNDACFFVAQENLDLFLVVADEDHVIEADRFLPCLSAELLLLL